MAKKTTKKYVDIVLAEYDIERLMRLVKENRNQDNKKGTAVIRMPLDEKWRVNDGSAYLIHAHEAFARFPKVN